MYEWQVMSREFHNYFNEHLYKFTSDPKEIDFQELLKFVSRIFDKLEKDEAKKRNEEVV